MSFEQVIRRAKRKALFVPTPTTQQVDFGRAQIEQLIPHRDPFLLVDRISAIDLTEQTLLGHRRVDPADPVLRGHFPGYPVYPGALLVEAMGQACLFMHLMLDLGRAHLVPEDRPRPVRLFKLHQALFQAEALPNDELDLLCKRLTHDDYTVVCAGQVRKDDAVCAVAVMEVFLVEEEG